MKTLLLQFIATIIAILTFPGSNLAQAPDLGLASSFVLFTAAGALGNTATSHINGNIGTNGGAITGFDPTTVMGSIESSNALTAQVSLDVDSAYQQLFNTAPTVTDHTPVFGGETLLPGVYSIGAAGSLSGNLILDAQGNPNAVFIFKFGGAFTTAALASVTLINSASADNVFWIAEGAISMAAGTNMKGTLIAHNEAISMAAGGTLVGRMFSTAGAATIYKSRLSLTPFPFLSPGQAPDFGSVASFAIYTTGGAIDNTGTTIINGNIGTNVGAITGYEPPSAVSGSIENANAVTAQAAIDLDAAYVQLYFTPATSTSHTPAFGGGETLTPGVYSIAAAGSIGGNLILDAQGDPNAIFIFKFGGAFTTGALATVSLINSAQTCNIFWVAEGAIGMAAGTVMKGTLIANDGAISLGAGGSLEGRMLSTLGAASTYENTISTECSFALPIELYSFTGKCDKQNIILKWSTATETDNKFFTLERSMEGREWQEIAIVAGSGNTSTFKNYSYTDHQPFMLNSMYRLKQTDLNGNELYGPEIAVKNCKDGQSNSLTIYPNPSNGRFDLFSSYKMDNPYLIEIYNIQGQKVYTSFDFKTKFDLENKASGIYFMNVHMGSNPTWLKIIIK